MLRQSLVFANIIMSSVTLIDIVIQTEFNNYNNSELHDYMIVISIRITLKK